eukprot:SAG11_NODE_1798_length_4246_cov_1.709670_5_plen_114_part_00
MVRLPNWVAAPQTACIALSQPPSFHCATRKSAYVSHGLWGGGRVCERESISEYEAEFSVMEGSKSDSLDSQRFLNRQQGGLLSTQSCVLTFLRSLQPTGGQMWLRNTTIVSSG